MVLVRCYFPAAAVTKAPEKLSERAGVAVETGGRHPLIGSGGREKRNSALRISAEIFIGDYVTRVCATGLNKTEPIC